MATEQPAYSVVQTLDNEVELRDYAPMILAEIDIDTTDAKRANDDAFGVLAKYIFGGNQPKERIGMTAPVQQSQAGEQIGMTSPVGRAPSVSGYTTSFVMPARYTIANLPAPLDPRIRIREVPAQRIAVIRFSGRANAARFAEEREALLCEVATANLQPLGEPWTAQYNPPWTPGFMRRNEVLVVVEAQ